MILRLPRQPLHLPYADIVLQNFEQAEQHYRDAFQLPAACEQGIRWRREATARWSISYAARHEVRMQAIMRVL